MKSSDKSALSPFPVRCARAAIDGAPVGELASGFLVLGSPIRLAILLAVSGRELCVNDLVGLFEVTQSAISQHLRRLRQQRLVTTRRTHKNVYYRLDEERTSWLLAEGLRHLAPARAAGPVADPATDRGGQEG